MKQFYLLFFPGILGLIFSCSPEQRSLALKPGMIITESVLIDPMDYRINASENLDEPVLLIRGDDITIDFQGATLIGSNDRQWPNEFYGLAIKVLDGTNISIKNLNVHGYKVALMADNVDSLKLSNADFSYNYRQKLYSTREKEDLSDWMSFHNNEADEWLRYGAGIYLKQCDYPQIKNVRITGGQNGIMMTNSNDGLFYNNTIHFNSAVGIGMYRSSRNRVMHNKLDWNVRGYSHGFYSRGQDSAGILCYEQSNDNIFAYNSATHSGDGFFLWPGQSTMDSGEGGCNNNILYKNDFSYAPANAVEVTFSKNQVIGNLLNGSNYGIWGGYSYESIFANNEIRNNQYGIAVEHGRENDIFNNRFSQNKVGIRLWERAEQPADWGYSKIKDVRSRNFQIEGNVFEKNAIPLQISGTEDIQLENNHFSAFQELLDTEDESSQAVQLINNTVYQTRGWTNLDNLLELNSLNTEESEILPYSPLEYPVPLSPLADGMDASLPEYQLKGRAYILVNEWGPYDFRYPICWLRNTEGDRFTFLLLGPVGNWKVVGGEGFEDINPKTGTFPATLTARPMPDAKNLNLEFEFIGNEVTNQFGRSYTKGTVVPFSFSLPVRGPQ